MPSDALKHVAPPPDYKAIGLMLKEAREAMKLPPEQVCRDIRISRNHLKAIEQGEVTSLPGDVYLRGYVKMLAGYLKVDLSYLEQYTRNLPDPQHKPKPKKGSEAPKIIFMATVALLLLAGVIYLGMDQKQQQAQEVSVREMPGYLKAYLAPDYVKNAVAPCLSYPQNIMNPACLPDEQHRLQNPTPIPTILDLAEVRPAWYLGR